MNDKDVVFLDNTEVLFCASEDGRNYFAYGDLPFSDFTVAEYLEYARALKGEKVTRQIIETFGIDPDVRVKRLCPAQYRCVQFLEKTRGLRQKALAVNLDGSKYTRKNAAFLDALIKLADDVYICVTDKRYMTKCKYEFKTMLFGKPTKRIKPKFYAAKLLAKRLGAKRIAIM